MSHGPRTAASAVAARPPYLILPLPLRWRLLLAHPGKLLVAGQSKGRKRSEPTANDESFRHEGVAHELAAISVSNLAVGSIHACRHGEGSDEDPGAEVRRRGPATSGIKNFARLQPSFSRAKIFSKCRNLSSYRQCRDNSVFNQKIISYEISLEVIDLFRSQNMNE
jgi:hypothetical protein